MHNKLKASINPYHTAFNLKLIYNENKLGKERIRLEEK
jgi:hypothetical protein